MGQSTSNGYGSSTTAEEVIKGVDLTGKTVFITGANTGTFSHQIRIHLLFRYWKRNCSCYGSSRCKCSYW
jgi:hypothetical protein